MLDLSHMLPGPYCTMLMADMGAEVIKVERPESGDSFRYRDPKIDGVGAAFLMVNRGKKSCALDLRSEQGLKDFMQLAKSADVIIEQYRPGVTKRLGIDYESVSRVNPDLVYCSISGYGQTGPYRDAPGHDINYLSISGVLDVIGRKNSAPSIAGVQIADMCGAQWALISILLALMARERGGSGQYIDLSMTDSVLPWLSLLLSDYAATGQPVSRGDTKSSGKYAFYNVYETSDGLYVSLGAAEPKFWSEFCRAVGRDDWITRQTDETLIPEVAELFKTRTRDEWVLLLFNKNCCFTPVKSPAEALEDAQLKQRGMIGKLECLNGGSVLNLSFPAKFSAFEPVKWQFPPALGEDNAELFNDKIDKKGDNNDDPTA